MTIHPHGYRVVSSELDGVARSLIGREDLTVTLLKPHEPPGRAGQPLRSGSGGCDEPVIRKTERGEQRTQPEPSSDAVHESFSEYEAPWARAARLCQRFATMSQTVCGQWQNCKRPSSVRTSAIARKPRRLSGRESPLRSDRACRLR